MWRDIQQSFYYKITTELATEKIVKLYKDFYNGRCEYIFASELTNANITRKAPFRMRKNSAAKLAQADALAESRMTVCVTRFLSMAIFEHNFSGFKMWWDVEI